MHLFELYSISHWFIMTILLHVTLELRSHLTMFIVYGHEASCAKQAELKKRARCCGDVSIIDNLSERSKDLANSSQMQTCVCVCLCHAFL